VGHKLAGHLGVSRRKRLEDPEYALVPDRPRHQYDQKSHRKDRALYDNLRENRSTVDEQRQGKRQPNAEREQAAVRPQQYRHTHRSPAISHNK
jgi:hypothetical protein